MWRKEIGNKYQALELAEINLTNKKNMEIEFTLKIKGLHEIPNYGLGSGVVSKIIMDFKGATEKDYLHNPMLQKQIYDKANELLNEHFEVTFDRVKAKQTKVKLSSFNKKLITALKNKNKSCAT